jgi:hypothetical protein
MPSLGPSWIIGTYPFLTSYMYASGAQYATEACHVQRSDYSMMIQSMQDAYEHENTGCGLGALTDVFLGWSTSFRSRRDSALSGVWKRQLGHLVSFYGGNTC